MTAYAGIDYGLGRSNIDNETGIRYGVISQHSIMPEAWEDSLEPVYGDPHCPECGNPIKDETGPEGSSDWPSPEHGCSDYPCLSCEEWRSAEDCFPEEPIGWESNDPDYTIDRCLDSDLFVLKSPYYTRAQFCSPCVPGAGNLDHPCETGPKTYCLGPDWFEDEKAPYPVYRVSDDSEVVNA